MSSAIKERTIELDGIEVFLREVPGSGTPAVFVHGNPTNSAQWIPFLERLEGPAIAFDLPGFGRSSRPDPIHFDHTVTAYANFVERLLEEIVPGRYRLVVHDWGALALIPAQRQPTRLERLVILNAVPLLPGYRWHLLARAWRRRGVGRVVNATNTKRATALALRGARPGFEPMPSDFVEMVWENWDAGTNRAVLSLYRSADPHILAAYGTRLGELACPALVVWGVEDRFIGARFARDYAAALPSAELIELEDAGHWAWIDRPETIDHVATFLAA